MVYLLFTIENDIKEKSTNNDNLDVSTGLLIKSVLKVQFVINRINFFMSFNVTKLTFVTKIVTIKGKQVICKVSPTIALHNAPMLFSKNPIKQIANEYSIFS